jgi:hypothetical protein
MIFERKPYDGVRMDELKVGKVLKFIGDVNRYMASTGVNARIGTLFTDGAKNQHKSEGRLKPGRFYQEDPIVILSELQIALRPRKLLEGCLHDLCNLAVAKTFSKYLLMQNY